VALYDGDCGFCTRWRDRMAARDRHGRVEWLSVHDPSIAERFPDLDRQDALRQMYVFDPGGMVTKGAEGWVTLFSAIDRLTWVAALSRIPGVAFLMGRIYRFIAERRYRISCATAPCRLPRGGGPGTGRSTPLLAFVLILTGVALLPVAGCGGVDRDPVQERLAAIADPVALEVMKAAFENYGGYEAWSRHSTVEYAYSLRFFGGRAEPLAISRQIHRLGLREERAYVEDLGVPAPRVVVLDGDRLQVSRGGSPVEDPAELEYPRALSKLVRWSFMNPWNLLAAGTVLEARAHRTPAAEAAIPADPCDVIRYRRTRDGKDGGPESDDWHDFYFSRLSRLVDRIHSYRADDHSYRVSIWSDYWTIGGIRIATQRRTYSSDELGVLGSLEAIADYSDIRFDVPFGDSATSDALPLAASAGGE
jgi:predicted DCC family thiol-disulfide oxidoreductase YuxK